MPGQKPRTLLESDFPVRAVSRVARADRFSPDPVYAVHRWWARRPPATFRALLLAAQLPSDVDAAKFWEAFAAETTVLEGKTVADPFAGGATSLVEASRLGAAVLGSDIDPLAVLIANQELSTLKREDLQGTADELLNFLTKSYSDLYSSADGLPLHYFYVRRVTCPECGHADHLFKSLILARDAGRPGGVVRDSEVTVFCPDCLQIHYVGLGRTHLFCCSSRRPLETGTFIRGKYRCPVCRKRASHTDLKTGSAPRTLVAVETTELGARRRIRPANDDDGRALKLAADALETCRDLPLPRSRMPALERDGRPQIYGVTSIADMFSERQLLVFGQAFLWLKSESCSPSTRGALALALSNALTTNNLFCSYATDYGRLAPLFSVRSYSLPTLAVELNPLNSHGGRGTIPATIRRLLRSQDETVRRHSWNPQGRRVSSAQFPARGNQPARVLRRDARNPGWREGSVDIVLTDPPYFDYIPYSDLSYFYRAWLKTAGQLGAVSPKARPLYPSGENGTRDFTQGLSQALRAMGMSLREGGLVIFTYHSTSVEAWTALKTALSRAKLTVTAAFPLWADAKSVGHDKEGNCEWDICFVCRPVAEGWRWTSVALEEWLMQTARLGVSAADKRSWGLASSVIAELREAGLARRGAQGRLNEGRIRRRNERSGAGRLA